MIGAGDDKSKVIATKSDAALRGATAAPGGPLPTVDVVVPAYNEELYIDACIDGILSQSYPSNRLRLLLVDAGSSDGTLPIAEARAADDERITVLAGYGRLTTPEALNVALGASDADIFARVEAHGRPARDYVSRAVEALAAGGEQVVGVGGQPRFAGESSFGRAFTLARSSPLGVGGSVYAAGNTRQIVDTVPWGVYRREALKSVGGFDPAMNHGEDEELNWRLKEAGMKVMLDGAISFEYVPRSSLAAAFRQYRDYGRARVRVVAAHPDFLKARHLAPAAFVVLGGGLILASPFSSTARIGLAALASAYTTAIVAGALVATGRDDLRLAPEVAACFPALHLGYGTGTIGGALRLLRGRVQGGQP